MLPGDESLRATFRFCPSDAVVRIQGFANNMELKDKPNRDWSMGVFADARQ